MFVTANRKTNCLTLPSKYQRSFSITSQALSDVPSNIIVESRILYGSRWTACKGLMAEYSKNSSIHCLRYIFEYHRPLYERLFWFIVFLISLYFVVYYSWATYVRWLDAPVIIGFHETLVAVHKIPFPTVTICPEIKMDFELFNFTNISEKIWSEIEEYQRFDNMGNLTNDELQQFADTLQICEPDVLERFASHLSKDIIADVAQTLVDLKPSLTFPFCGWHGRMYRCQNILKPVVTDEGLCYQFNGLQDSDMYRDPNYISYSDKTQINYNKYLDEKLTKLNNITGVWSLAKGYVGQGISAYPQRSVLPKVKNGFKAIMLGLEDNFDSVCRSFKQGYKVYFSSPESVPMTLSNYILVPHDQDVFVSIIPQYIISTDDLHSVDPQKRECYFDDERYLRFFKSYSQYNCHTECMANFTIAKCGCVKFWMPKPLDTPICSLAEIDCYVKALEEMDSVLIYHTQRHYYDPNVKIMCDCMPSCHSLEYNFEISRADNSMKSSFQASRADASDADGYHATRLSVHFKETHFTAIKRTLMFGVTSLIANFGCVFGLFMGVSIISVIEFIYFFSIRLIHNLHKRRMIANAVMKQEE